VEAKFQNVINRLKTKEFIVKTEEALVKIVILMQKIEKKEDNKRKGVLSFFSKLNDSSRTDTTNYMKSRLFKGSSNIDADEITCFLTSNYFVKIFLLINKKWVNE